MRRGFEPGLFTTCLEAVWEVTWVIKQGYETQTLPHGPDRRTVGDYRAPHSPLQTRRPRPQDRYARTGQRSPLSRARRGRLAAVAPRLSPAGDGVVVLLVLAPRRHLGAHS